jgi:O-antigen/teichoic acid export membrane protein
VAATTLDVGPQYIPSHARAAGMAVHSKRDLVADLGAATLSLALLAVLQNADVMVFGSRLPRHSGAYGAISVPSKALVFLALLLVNYLLPETSISAHHGRHALRQLATTLGVLTVPALGLLGVAAVMPKTLLGAVFGTRYEDGAGGFAVLVLAMVLLCVTLVLTIYLLGTGWRWVVVPLTLGAALLIGLCALAPASVAATADADLAAQSALTVTMVVAVTVRHRELAKARLRARPELVLLPRESTTTPA